MVEKTAVQKEGIRHSLRGNRLMRFLDDEQIDTMIQKMKLVDFDPGEYIVKEGAKGDFFWVLESGIVDIGVDNTVVSTFGKGKSFGEQGIVYRTLRSGSARAKTQVSCWGISAADFEEALGSSTKQKDVFARFASKKDEAGNNSMVFDDFVKSLGVESSAERVHAGISKNRLKMLFDLADTDNNGTLAFDEYARFLLLLSKPEPEFDIAYQLFDPKRNGIIDKDGFIKVMKGKKGKDMFGVDFNAECDLVRRYFGSDGRRKLRFAEFSQFFIELQFEILRQSFLSECEPKHLFLAHDKVINILSTIGRGTIDQNIIARLASMNGLSSTSGAGLVSYGEFCALLSLSERVTGIMATLKAASTVSRTGIDKDQFKTAAKGTGLVGMSPLEVEILYALADRNSTGRIRPGDLYGTLIKNPDETEPSLAPVAPEKKEPQSFFDQLMEKAVTGAKHFFLGAIAGGIGSFAVYPIDLVKTRMQNQKKIPGAQVLYKNSFDCFYKVLTAEGIRGLYKGLGPQLLGVAPEKAIKLTVNDMFRSAFSDPTKGGAIYFPLEVLAGAAAGASQVVFTNPLEIVKIRLQVQGENVRLHGAAPKSAITICQELGFAGLYKGASACFLRDIPFSGIYFPVYGLAKEYFADEDGKLNWKQIMLAGALAGVPAASLVTPADVIKTRLQVEARKGDQVYKGIMDCAKKVYQQEGFTAFFKGAGARVFRSSPQFGVTLLAYELFHQWLTPELETRPPTNAPISSEEIYFGFDDMTKKIRTIDERLSRLRV